MKNKLIRYESEDIGEKIYTVRGQRVIIDSDLAAIYGVSTKVLNQAVKRNADRFPDDFAFQLTPQEAADLLRSQTITSNKRAMRSQFVTASKRNIRFCPYVFTEHGTMMAANVLRSTRAVQMSVFVVRAFVKIRGLLGDTRTLTQKLAELEKKLTERLNVHERAIVHVLGEMRRLMAPQEPATEQPKRKIGFEVKEKVSKYQTTRKKNIR